MITQENLHKTLVAAKAFLPEDWKSKYHAFLQDEMMSFFAKQLFIQLNSTSSETRLPYFEEEIQQDFAKALNQFKMVFANENEFVEPKIVSQLLEKTPFKELLLLMGQRITSASVQDEKAIPPLRNILLEELLSTFKQRNNSSSKSLGKACRSLSRKHFRNFKR